jgi:hypothetical protein
VLESGEVPVRDLITRVFDFEQTTDAWKATKNSIGIKNMIRASSD